MLPSLCRFQTNKGMGVAHEYDVHYTDRNGRQSQTPVLTPNHHEDHSQQTWLNHVVDLLEQIGVKVASDGISRVVYRGRR